MTITFLAPDGVAVTAQQERQAQAAQHGGGSGRRLGGRSGFRVDTPSTVLTATSTTWTLGPCAAMIDPGATTHQGMYGWSSDANIAGTVTAADVTNPRKDIVYIQVNDSSAGDGSGATTAPVLYLAGTPAVTPVAPTLPARSFLLGTISVPIAGVGSPTVVLNSARFAAAGAPLPVYSLDERDLIPDKYDGLIVQRRDIPSKPTETWDGTIWLGNVRHVEMSYASASVPNNTAWGPGIGSIDAARSLYSSFATMPANDEIEVSHAGVYSLTWYMVIAGAVSTPVFAAVNRGAERVFGQQFASGFENTIAIPSVHMNAGERFKLIMVQTSGSARDVTHKVRVTRVG